MNNIEDKSQGRKLVFLWATAAVLT